MKKNLQELKNKLELNEFTEILNDGISENFLKQLPIDKASSECAQLIRITLKKGQINVAEAIINAAAKSIYAESLDQLKSYIESSSNFFQRRKDTRRPRICDPGRRFKNLNRSALIICSRSESFDFKTMRDKGLAGSETAALAIAKGFLKRGHQAVIVCSGNFEEYLDEGVLFYSLSKIQELREFFWDTIIAERDTRAFDMDWNCSASILDLHDASYNPENFSAGRLSQIDEIWTKTSWHKKHIAKLYPQIKNPIHVVANGVWDNKEAEEIKLSQKDKNYILFSSDPSRGLRVLLKIFPQLKKKFPKLRLDIANGWLDAYGEKYGEGFDCVLTEKAWEARKLWESEEYKKMDVNFIGRLGQNELWELQKKAGLWLMPTDFAETSCITAMEFVKAKTPMVISVDQAGALSGTAPRKGCYRIEGKIDSKEFQEEFLKKCIEILESEQSYKKAFDDISSVNISKYSWNRAAETAFARSMQISRRNLIKPETQTSTNLGL